VPFFDAFTPNRLICIIAGQANATLILQIHRQTLISAFPRHHTYLYRSG
jgi:hypothetical protein